MHLSFYPSTHKEVGHPLHTLKILPHFIFEIGSIGMDRGRVILLRFEDDPDDRRGGSACGIDDGFLHIFRIGGDFIQFIRYPEKGVIHMGSHPEPQGQGSLIVGGGALHLHQPGNPFEDLFLLFDNLALNLIRRRPGPERCHGNLGLYDIRC